MAVVVGAVTMGPHSSIWYGAVARADADAIEIGEGSNVQDGCTLHSDAGFPLLIGKGVTVGHRVVLHGARVDDDVLVGMGSIVMNGAHIGSGSIVAAGAVVTPGTEVPPGSVVGGVPAKIEAALGKAVPLVIAFLANLLGLGGSRRRSSRSSRPCRHPSTRRSIS